MGKFFEYWKMAYFNIRMNKVRAFLTMLGMIIGVMSLVVLVSIVNGATKSVTDSIANIGTNIAGKCHGYGSFVIVAESIKVY